MRPLNNVDRPFGNKGGQRGQSFMLRGNKPLLVSDGASFQRQFDDAV